VDAAVASSVPPSRKKVKTSSDNDCLLSATKKQQCQYSETSGDVAEVLARPKSIMILPDADISEHEILTEQNVLVSTDSDNVAAALDTAQDLCMHTVMAMVQTDSAAIQQRYMSHVTDDVTLSLAVTTDSVTVTMQISKTGVASLSRMKFSGHLRHMTIFR